MTPDLFDAHLLPVLAVWTRLTGATLAIPAFRFYRVPKTFLSLLLFGLALPVAQFAPALALPAQQSVWLLLAAELLSGLILGFGLMAAFAAIDVFGHVLDTQSGLGIAQLLGLSQQRPQAITAALFSAFGISLFFAANLHLDLLETIVTWYRIVPATWLIDEMNDPMRFAILLQRSFSYGVLMAMPLAALLFLGDTLLAFAGRSMPQLNVLFLSFPIKLLMVLFGLLAASHLMQPVLLQLFDDIGFDTLKA